MPFIQNVSLQNIVTGNHIRSNNCMLIQIVDPLYDFPTPIHHFNEVHRFEFLDIDEKNPNYTDLCEFAFTDQQAEYVVLLLRHALNNDMDVVVHCHAGVCRSGAITEIGVILGFLDSGSHRIPNILVKNKMLRVLGLTYS